MTQTIMIIEDEESINQLLRKILEEEGYQTIQAYSGSEAWLLLEKETPDMLLLDLMLPGKSGESLLMELRESLGFTGAVLIISAKGTIDSKVSLLKLGADDYMTKPFAPEEVIARVEANLRKMGRRDQEKSLKEMKYKKIVIRPESRQVFIGKDELFLTAHEYDILSLLVRQPEKVYTRETLYEMIWKDGYYGENNTVNVHVSNLRKKIREFDPSEDYIQTVYGIGFRLC